MTDHLVRQTDLTLRRGRVCHRREFLRWIPAAGFAAASPRWTDLMAAETAQLRRRGKACILLWMEGGPSQFETFSPLPHHRNGGETKAIGTSVSGIQIAENLPRTAEVMDDICLIRSMSSKEGSHPRATYLLHTGYLPNPTVRHPAFGSHAAHQLADVASELPSFVRIGGPRGNNASGGGILGVDYDPFMMRDPARPPENATASTDGSRFRRRLVLRNRLDDAFEDRGATREAEDQQKLYDRAARMVLSSEMKAFDVSSEPQQMRDAYGSSPFGAGCLLARRLIEAGVTFVEVALRGWDTHQDNFARTKKLCEQMDQPYAQLLRDLQQRGMLDDVLVIWMGEFGRTPRINPRAGRDHFPRAFNVALAGGGVKGGQVIGATDEGGTAVTDRPVTVADLFRTFCHVLEMDADRENMSPIGRPIYVVEDGEVVQEVLSFVS